MFKFLESVTCLVLAFTPVAVASFNVAPVHRNQTGPALVRACGQPVADLLKETPDAALERVHATIPLNVASTCHIDFCSAFQFADNVRNTVVLHSPERISVNVSATLPSPSSFPSDFVYAVRLVKPTVDLQPSLPSEPIEFPYGPGQASFDVDLFGKYSSEIASPQCVILGQCMLSVQLLNKNTLEVINSVCSDFTVA